MRSKARLGTDGSRPHARPRSRNGHRSPTRCKCRGCAEGQECIAVLDRTDSALHSSDRAQAVMARGLEVISGAVPAQAVGWYPVTSRGEDAAGSLIALSRPLSVDPQRARREYVRRYHRDDPFAPRHLLDSRRPLLTMADIGGRKGLLSTPYGGELLPEYGVAYETGLYIRDGGRMLGSVRISRTAEEGDFSHTELDFLQRAHLFLEGSYGAALEPVPRLLRVEHLSAKGLTAREIEVARAAATGATTPQIADELVIAKSTVKGHLIHVFEKLGVRTRTELAVRLGRSGP